MIYVVGNIELDISCYECRRNGEPQPMQPQVFNVLHYLIIHRHRVVTKRELLETLWPAQHVSESALTQQIRAARHALGDSGEHQAYIKTLYGRGYRFIAPVAIRPPNRSESNGSLIESEAQPSALHPAETYRQLIETTLINYAQRSATSETIRTEVVFDRHRQQYRLTHIGRDQQHRVYQHLIHIDIMDHIVWIQRDDTRAGLIAALIESGIPSSRIRSGNKPAARNGGTTIESEPHATNLVPPHLSIKPRPDNRVSRSYE